MGPSARILASGSAVVAALAVIVFPCGVQAQGSVSTQGLGFPQGQLSSRALATGGAVTESDPISPVNPAAIVLFGGGTLVSFQLEPEWRSTSVGNQSATSNLARYPLTMGIVPIGARAAVAVSFSSLLDRTFVTREDTRAIIGADTIAGRAVRRSSGGIADVRLAAGYRVAPWLRLGAGVHALTGQNVFSVTRSFTDTARFATLQQSQNTTFRGNAVSVGAELVRDNVASLGVAYRHGGRLSLALRDSIFGRADVPNRLSVSAAYLGLRGAVIAVRAAQDRWSSLSGLVSTARARDTRDFGVGADVAGPRIGRNVVFLRAGARSRTLPFGLGEDDVRERSLSGGFGVNLAGGRGLLDGTLVRSARSLGAADERAWTLSVGIAVRP